MNSSSNNSFTLPPVWLSLIPVGFLLCSMAVLIIVEGALAVQDLSKWLLLGSAAVAAFIALTVCKVRPSRLFDGLRKSAGQILPSLPILLLIGTVSATWMLSGVVPLLIDYGLRVLDPDFFLVIACGVCALISVLTGSSWTTIATIGVAFMGIGTVMGYSSGWIAGAIISGAYFGDKISPLSDTTVLASGACGVDLFSHIRYMMITTVPSMALAMGVFAYAGLSATHLGTPDSGELTAGLQSAFNLTPWLLTVPAITGILIMMRLNSYLTLSLSSLLGLAAMFVFQPDVVAELSGQADPGFIDAAGAGVRVLLTETSMSTGSELFDSLVATGGMVGMLPTVWLVSSAMVFGGMLIGNGMLRSITSSMTRRIRTPRSTVSATVGSGLALNSVTGDQYLSIIMSANLFGPLYSGNSLERRLLSRTVEDSVSVTSVLIPWNSCGVTQATVLGVPTLTYLPYCVFNIVSPLMSLVMAWAGIKIRRTVSARR